MKRSLKSRREIKRQQLPHGVLGKAMKVKLWKKKGQTFVLWQRETLGKKRLKSSKR